MSQTRMIIVGGFLGAGKTTLLAQAAGVLARRGARVGLLTNDQAPGLVDTALLKQQGFEVGEVAGGCFCCRFDQFVEAARRLAGADWPDAIIAEPVGSCTDLAATVIRPLQSFHAAQFRVLPFTAVVDPVRLREALDGQAQSSLAEHVRYIYQKQLEEADYVVLNKQDLLPPGEMAALKGQLQARLPQTRLFTAAALTGAGVREWLDAVWDGPPSGGRAAEVDYQVYADGEAALGWLNATVHLSGPKGYDWPGYCERLLARLQEMLRARQAEVAHLKVFLSGPGLAVMGNFTGTEARPALRVRGACGKDDTAVVLVVNARVQIDPEELKAAVEEALHRASDAAVSTGVSKIEYFRPAPPKPTHRMAERQIEGLRD